MKNIGPTTPTPFNPPLRIFAASGTETASDNARLGDRFLRPKLQRSVARERIAPHFSKRRFPFGSPLD